MRQSSQHLKTHAAAFAAIVLAAGAANADEILLRSGGRLTGVIVERTETKVTIETGPGRVTLPMSRVDRIVEGRTALEAFSERAAGLGPGDAAGWAALARWAEERDLLTQARIAWERVLAVDPGHPEANAGLGRVSFDGVWMSADDAYRARGYVSYEGRWLTPAEHDAALRERAAEHAAAIESREADIRAREADARAREAEARAQEADAQATGGIPLGYVYGSGYGYGYGYNPGVGGGDPYAPRYAPNYDPDYDVGRGHGNGPHHPSHREPARPATHPSSLAPATPPSRAPRNQAGTQPRPSLQPNTPPRPAKH